MTSFPEQGELQNAPEMFEGTVVPKLSLEEDGDWLASLVPDPDTPIDDSYVARLNDIITASLQPSPGYTGPDSVRIMRPVRASVGSTSLQTRPARLVFQETLHMDDSLSPLFKARPYVRKPVNFVAISRIINTYAASDMARVAQTAGHLYTVAPETLQKRIQMLDDAGVDVSRVFRGNPNLLRAPGGQHGRSFIESARLVRNPKGRELAPSVAKAAGVQGPAQSAEMSSLELSPAEAARYARLAEAAFMDEEELIRRVPEVREFDEERLEAVIARVAKIAETGADVRFRDITRPV